MLYYVLLLVWYVCKRNAQTFHAQFQIRTVNELLPGGQKYHFVHVLFKYLLWEKNVTIV